MKSLNLTNLYATGTVLGLVLTASTACAQKESGKIDVKTGEPAVQSAAEIQTPDYMDPVREMIAVRREMDRFLGRPFASFSVMPRTGDDADGPFVRPDMDLTEQADAYQVQMDLPGMDKSEITVEVKDNILTVQAERRQEVARKEGDRLLMNERIRGFTSRAVMLSKPVDAEKVTAGYKDGVLSIRLPKVQADTAPRRVRIG